MQIYKAARDAVNNLIAEKKKVYYFKKMKRHQIQKHYLQKIREDKEKLDVLIVKFTRL